MTGLLIVFLPAALSGTPALAQQREPAPAISVKLDKPFPDSKAAFEQAVEIIKKDSYNSADLTDEVVYYAALKGLLRQLSPATQKELLELWAPQVDAPRTAQATGEMMSIGVTFGLDAGWLVIADVTPYSPADEAGLRLHDRVIEIDGSQLTGKSIEDARAMILKPAGTRLTLKIQRDGKFLDVAMVTRKLEALDVRAEVVDGVGVVRVLNFSAVAIKEMDRELKKLADAKARGIVVDVRGTPGGVADVGRLLSCKFLAKGALQSSTAGHDRVAVPYFCQAQGDTATPLAILVNGDTASTSELFVAGLRDSGRAKVVGTTTRGMGTEKNVGRLKNGYAFTYVLDVMYGPKGTRWLERGIDPDVVVAMDSSAIEAARNEPQAAKRLAMDKQLAAAFALLK
ncbi:MAG: S41 family peptidase [Elusimicrobia bacterium]|nr:S41 family peptidase [Elusimicrobiota bacterium]